MVIDPNDVSQRPQPPPIFTTDPNALQIQHNVNNPIVISDDNTDEVIVKPIEMVSKPVSNRQPPFFVKVDPFHEFKSKSREMSSTTHTNPISEQKSRNPDKGQSVADSMPTPELPQHPLPASTKPLADKKDCVVMGRAGHCFPYYPVQNVYKCFSEAGVVAMDVVRCSWVRACCVLNFFR